MSFTVWGPENSGGTGIGPLNSGATERRILTVKNLGPNTIWLSCGAANSNVGPTDPITNDPISIAGIAANETVVFGVLPGESYYYAVVGLGAGGATVLVWEG